MGDAFIIQGFDVLGLFLSPEYMFFGQPTRSSLNSNSYGSKENAGLSMFSSNISFRKGKFIKLCVYFLFCNYWIKNLIGNILMAYKNELLSREPFLSVGGVYSPESQR